jgi:hypothetical protein
MKQTPRQLASYLREKVTERGSFFFKPSALRFFGDTMANYGARLVWIDDDGEARQVYELYRIRPVKHGLSGSAWFCATTFVRLYPPIESD